MEPDARSIELTRGSAWKETWKFSFEGVATNLTGCTGELRIRPASATEPLVTGTFTPTATLGNAELELTEEQIDELTGYRVLHWTLIITDTLGKEHQARGTVWMKDEG